jgi:hypothetical protein
MSAELRLNPPPRRACDEEKRTESAIAVDAPQRAPYKAGALGL